MATVMLPGLVDLAWEDVLFPSLLPLLSPTDWISLGQTCKDYHELITAFLRQNQSLVLRPWDDSAHIFKLLTRHSINLREGTFSSCDWLTDDLFQPVIQANQLIERLDISNCRNLSEGSLQMVAVSLQRLTHLLLTGCTWVTGPSIEYLAFHHSKRIYVRNLPTNEEQIFSDMTPDDSLQVMGQAGLRTMAGERRRSRYEGKDKLYENLQSSSYISKIRRRASKELPVPPWRQQQLRYLDLNKSGNLNDKVVSSLASAFTDLEFLGMSDNTLLTDTSMITLAKNLKKLKNLDISGCYRITDRGLFTVSKHCKLLTTINVTNCNISGKLQDHLKDKGVRFV